MTQSNASGQRKWAAVKKSPHFRQISASGDKSVTRSVVVFAAQKSALPLLNDSLPETLCVGLTASRKVGNAIKRNRAKRRLRAVMDEIYDPKYNGLIINSVARYNSPHYDFLKMCKDITKTLDYLASSD